VPLARDTATTSIGIEADAFQASSFLRAIMKVIRSEISDFSNANSAISDENVVRLVDLDVDDVTVTNLAKDSVRHGLYRWTDDSPKAMIYCGAGVTDVFNSLPIPDLGCQTDNQATFTWRIEDWKKLRDQSFSREFRYCDSAW
jgi:hypothetical protein